MFKNTLGVHMDTWRESVGEVLRSTFPQPRHPLASLPAANPVRILQPGDECGRGSSAKSLEKEDTAALMKSITPERNQQQLQERGGTDFGFAFGEAARFRVSVFKQRGMIGMVLRRIPNEFLTFEQLGLPPVVKELIQRPRGLFLVTGPTGSGKTTSLASMINWMNNNLDHHIITMEDPIEYYHDHNKSTINQREIGCGLSVFP